MTDPRRHIWILEDDDGSRFVYEELLGLRFSLAFFEDIPSFIDGLALAEADARRSPDLIIADLRLGGESFLSFLEADDDGSLTGRPLLIVSCIDDLDVLRACLRFGALDYLTKPFGRSQLIVKVEQILARTTRTGVDLSSPLLMSGGSDVTLTAKEFLLLAVLRQSPELAATREEILGHVWGGQRVSAKTLDVHLHNLRKKLAVLGAQIVFDVSGRYVLRYDDQARRPSGLEP